MKPIAFLAPLLVTACQFTGDDNQTLGGETQKALWTPPGFHAPVTKRMQDYAFDQVKFDYDAALISFSNFIYLEDAEPTKSELKDFTIVSETYGLDSSATVVYDVGHHPIRMKYVNVLGRSIKVLTNDHQEYRLKIRSIVLVRDALQDKYYYAGVVDVPEAAATYGTWATTGSSRRNHFPFVEVSDPLTSDLAITYFDSLAEYHVAEKEIESNLDNFQYEQNDVRIFDARPGEKYVMVQHNWIGDCESLLANYTALYHVTPSGWVLDTEGQLEDLLVDMIDIDGDFYPEFLMGDFRHSVIYEITNKGFTKKSALEWNRTIYAC